MTRSGSMLARLALVGALVAASSLLLADDAGPEVRDPLALDLEEQIGVKMILIDAVVVDRDGRTVPDLTIDDFDVVIDGKQRPVDTLDASCPGGATDDPRGVRSPARREVPPAPETGRKIVLALDYLHLSQMARVDVLEQAREIVKHAVTDNDEVMIAALNGGLRIEQTFTSDADRLAEVLKRMEYDISLWEPSFAHLTEEPFFTGMQALFDVAGSVPGSKAIVLFSNSAGAADESDLEFARLAASASTSRCSIYPVHATGLVVTPPG